MYNFLKPSEESLIVSSVADANRKQKYIFNLDNGSTEFFTEPVGYPAAHHVHHRIVKESTIVGSTTATLQSSLDGIIWFDTEDSAGDPITVTIADSLTSFLYLDIYAFGNFQRWKFTGANTGGSISIQTLVK